MNLFQHHGLGLIPSAGVERRQELNPNLRLSGLMKLDYRLGLSLDPDLVKKSFPHLSICGMDPNPNVGLETGECLVLNLNSGVNNE